MPNRGSWPLQEKIETCREIQQHLLRLADERSIYYGSLIRVFGRYPHGRTYQGYFRDAPWLRRIGPNRWSIDRHAEINEKTVRSVMNVRTRHRDAARLMKEASSV